MVKKIRLLPLCHGRATAMPYSLLPLCHTLLPLCHTLATAMPCLCYRYAIPLRPLSHAFATAMPYPLRPLCHTHCYRYAMPITTVMPYSLLPLCHTLKLVFLWLFWSENERYESCLRYLLSRILELQLLQDYQVNGVRLFWNHLICRYLNHSILIIWTPA